MRAGSPSRSSALHWRVVVVQVLTDVAFLPCERCLCVEVLFALVGIVCELVLLSLGLLRGHASGDKRRVWGRAVRGQRLERLRDAHHELVRDVAETLDLALKLGNFALERVVVLLDVKDVRTG